MDLEKPYDKVNRKALWQVTKMDDEDGILLYGIKSIYDNSIGCISVKGECERFTINSGEGQGCTMSPWLFNVYMDALMKEVKMGIGRRRESGDCLALCMQMTWFCVMSQRKT